MVSSAFELYFGPQQRLLSQLGNFSLTGPRLIFQLTVEVPESVLRGVVAEFARMHEACGLQAVSFSGNRTFQRLAPYDGSRIVRVEQLRPHARIDELAAIEPGEGESIVCLFSHTHSQSTVIALSGRPLFCDLWSLGLLAEKICEAAIPSLDTRRDVPVEPVQYPDYIGYESQRRPGTRVGGASGCFYTRGPGEASWAPSSDISCRQVALELSTQTARILQSSGREVEAHIAALWATYVWHLNGGVDSPMVFQHNGRVDEALRDTVGVLSDFACICPGLSRESCFLEVVSDFSAFFSQELRPFDALQLPDGHSSGPMRMSSLYSFSSLDGTLAGFEKVAVLDVQHVRVPVTLALEVIKFRDTITLRFSFNNSGYSIEEANRLSREFLKIVERASESEISCGVQCLQPDLVGGPADTHITSEAIEGDRWLFDDILCASSRFPDNCALSHEGMEVSFHGLRRAWEQLGARLRAVGIGEGSVVQISAAHPIHTVIAYLACWSCGAAFSSVAGEVESDELARRQKDAGASVRLVVGAQCGDLDSFEIEPLSTGGVSRCEDASESQSLAYILYTSGSTGQARGVRLSRGNIGGYVTAIWERLRLRNDEQFTLGITTSLAADLSFTLLWPGLANACKIVLFSRNEVLDAELFSAEIRRAGIDIIKTTPSHINAMLLNSMGDACLPKQMLILGGEIFSTGLARKIVERSPKMRLINHYGPTETTVGVATFEVTPSHLHAWTHHSLPIGKALPGVSLTILDSRGSEVHRGIAGEIVVSGRQVGLGYLGSDSSDIGGFVNSDSTSPVRRYRTGDIGVQSRQGDILFLGRSDSQAKVRGSKVDLRSIEQTLKAHPSITDARVLETRGALETSLVCAYVSERRVAEEGLRRFLNQALGDFSVPTRFFRLAAMPLTDNGKLDTSYLLSMLGQHTEGRGGLFAQDTSSLEGRLAHIWEDVLGVPLQSRTDDFFLSGGHSLLATQLVARIRHEFKVPFALTEIFENGTFDSLASALRREVEGASSC